ncbi:MAG: lysophospholipase [Planctomycetota bacterium]
MELQSSVVADGRMVSFPQGERFVRSWVPSVDDVARPFALCVVHGLGDHSGRFDAFGRWFAARGVPVHSFDQIGHGKSPGKRMVIPDYDYLLRDVGAFLSWVKDKVTLPVGLFGQSMGGNLVLNHQLRLDEDAAFVVAGSPMLRVPRPPTRWMQLVYRAVGVFAPNLILKTPVDPANLSRNPEVQRAYVEDPLVEQKLSLRLGIALIDSGQWALDHASELTVPTLLTHGDADEITCHEASKEFVESSNGVAAMNLWTGGVHDLHADLVEEEYRQSLLAWMSSQAKPG